MKRTGRDSSSRPAVVWRVYFGPWEGEGSRASISEPEPAYRTRRASRTCTSTTSRNRDEPGQHEGVVEVIVAKQRNGPTGEITLSYLKEFMRYEDFAVGGPFED